MNNRHDPAIRAAIAELASASPPAPSAADLAATASVVQGTTTKDDRLASPAVDTRVGWRGPLIAFGTAVVVLVAVAGAALLASTGPSDVIDTTTSVATSIWFRI